MKKKGLFLVLGLMIAGAGIGTAAQLNSNAEDAKSQTAQEAAAEAGEFSQKEEDERAAAAVSTAQTVETTETLEAQFGYSGIADIAEGAMPSIVAITNKSVQEVQSFYRGRTFQYESESCGSGIIVGENDTELLICTNNHVVEGASELTVSFIDESSYPALIKGTDASNDLAVVAVNLEDIDADTLDQIRIARMGDSDSMRVGEQVVAIGNALGYGQSVTTGIVSAQHRTIEVQEGRSIYSYEDLIQTDAAINPGNSGGALLNMNGEVIGINSAKASSSGVEGMGYAIPLSKAQPILEKLMNKVTRSRVDESEAAYLGISGDGVSQEAVLLYNIPAGIYLTQVGEGSPAEEAGLMESDIITAFDDETVTSMADLKDLLQYYKGGETVELTVQSAENGAYAEKTISITLGLKSDYAM